MPRSRPPYALEYRRQMIELVRAGRTPEDLAREFEPSAQAIRNWVVQAEHDEGRRADGPSTAERNADARPESSHQSSESVFTRAAGTPRSISRLRHAPASARGPAT